VRVGLSLLTLSPGDLGGSETYARALARTLATQGTHEYTAFVPKHSADAAGGLRTVLVGEAPLARRGPARIAAMKLSTRLTSAVRREARQVDVLHYPLTVPIPRSAGPTAVTIHDLLHHDHPEHFSRSRRAFRRSAYDGAARDAAALVVPSHFVRERVLAQLGLEEARVHVVAHGVDHALFSPGDEAREPFLLYPARPWPHKNHARLLQAFVLLRAELPELRLVLTGGGLEELGAMPEGVDSLGTVRREELASLYRTAACLVFPSLHEGFGLPPLEAMASGCPVAAANAASIPQICGDAAVYFDPRDPEAIANGVREALALADELRELGIARAAEFTWEESARRHEEVYLAASRG
jgi:glycosyltransferase involved in cell wall biosynthesis